MHSSGLVIHSYTTIDVYFGMCVKHIYVVVKWHQMYMYSSHAFSFMAKHSTASVWMCVYMYLRIHDCCPPHPQPVQSFVIDHVGFYGESLASWLYTYYCPAVSKPMGTATSQLFMHYAHHSEAEGINFGTVNYPKHSGVTIYHPNMATCGIPLVYRVVLCC